jgi:hypothetical protein
MCCQPKGGREVRTTAFRYWIKGKQLPEGYSSSGKQKFDRNSCVAPGSSFDLPIDLALYKITTPGVYSVAVSRPQEETGTVTHSNNVTFEIE